jgi:hypothetical protein
MQKYHYLKEFVDIDEDDELYADNWFYTVKEIDIQKAEKETNMAFPLPLKEFWKEIGYGKIIRAFYQEKKLRKDSNADNYLMSPESVLEIIVDPENADWIYHADDSNEEMLEKGYFPFFDVQQGEYFFWMKAGSDSVYAPREEIIEERFEDFIYNLYHIHPDYYWKIILEPEYWDEKKLEDKSKQDIDKNWHLGRHRR